MPNETDDREIFLRNEPAKILVAVNALLAIAYFIVISFFFRHGNVVLFGLLIAGEVFHIWQLLVYLYTVYDRSYLAKNDPTHRPFVDVFITVAGEPVEIVKETALAAKNMTYPNFAVHILNDGLVAKKDNYREIEVMAKRLGINCITRTVPGGAKAGNINNAMRFSAGELIAVLDADHIPHRDFLQKTAGYFADDKVAFVQSPQFYKNFRENAVTAGAWEQQALFFGAICRGKNRFNAVTMCGTNMLIRRKALSLVGGMCEESVAEDLLTGLFLHEKGWKSVYVPEVLCEGLAPEDFSSYWKQQHRWARGVMDMIFRYGFPFRKGLNLTQKIQYLSSASFFFSGLVVVIDAVLPLVFFFTGQVAIETSTMLLAAAFLPYIMFTLYVLQKTSNYSYSFRSLAFSMACFDIHISALWSAISGRKISFAVTSKKKLEGNFANYVIPQMTYIAISFLGIAFALYRFGSIPSVLTNSAWAILNVVIFGYFVRAALPAKVGLPQKQKRRLPEISFVKNKSVKNDDMQPVYN